MDEVRIYNDIRTLVEIQADMYNTDASDVNLVGYWNFDQEIGVNANDQSSFTNNGTLIGSTDIPLWTYRVINEQDLGTVGDLRYAITQANANAGTHYVDFSIPTASVPYQIDLTGGLPQITERVVVDATSQTGWTINSNMVTINDGVGIADGFDIDSGITGEFYGLSITNFVNKKCDK